MLSRWSPEVERPSDYVYKKASRLESVFIYINFVAFLVHNILFIINPSDFAKFLYQIVTMAQKVTEFGSFVDKIFYNIFFQPDDELSARYVKEHLSPDFKVR